jgi:hypothetical protein
MVEVCRALRLKKFLGQTSKAALDTMESMQLDAVKLPSKTVYMPKGHRDLLLQISYQLLPPDSTNFLLMVEDASIDIDTVQECKTADNQVYWIGPAIFA